MINKGWNIGNINYEIFFLLIVVVKSGNNVKFEEIEYVYLYYFLIDECILFWGVFGGIGLIKIEFISELLGVIIEVEDIKFYVLIE